MVTSGFGTSSWTNSSRNDGTAIKSRISTGTMVQITSSVVLCVVRDGTGFFRALNRTTMMPSRTMTNTAIAVVIQNRKVLKPEMSSITGVTAPCMPICQGVGWPIPASAAPALASKIPKISAVALTRDNTGIALGSELPRSRPLWRCRCRAATHAYQIHVYHATVGLTPASTGGVLHREIWSLTVMQHHFGAVDSVGHQRGARAGMVGMEKPDFVPAPVRRRHRRAQRDRFPDCLWRRRGLRLARNALGCSRNLHAPLRAPAQTTSHPVAAGSQPTT